MIEQLDAWGIETSRNRISLLQDFASTLYGYEEANVIGAKTEREILEEHILDSLSCLLYEEIWDAETLVDVGSGGGLPGLPLGVHVEGLRLSLIEATSKKARFLDHVTKSLGLSSVQVIPRRVEEVGVDVTYREKFDVATARALASLDVLAEYCLPLVRLGGSVIAMKGRIEEEELRKGSYAARMVGGEISEVITVTRLPQYEQKERHLVVFTKKSKTPPEYPRRVGLPTKKPLGEMPNA